MPARAGSPPRPVTLMRPPMPWAIWSTPPRPAYGPSWPKPEIEPYTSRGLRACTVSKSKPSRCFTGGRMFSISTSALSTRRISTSRAPGAFRFSDSDLLLRCRCWKSQPCPLPVRPGAAGSGGGATRMTSAPQSASWRTQVGPARATVRSMTRTSPSGRWVATLPIILQAGGPAGPIAGDGLPIRRGLRRRASRSGWPWFAVGVREHRVERHPEHPGDLEGHLQGGGITALLDRDDGLPGHPDALRQLRLRHLTVGEPQRAYGVGDPGRLAHDGGLQPSPVGDELDRGSDDRPQHEPEVDDVGDPEVVPLGQGHEEGRRRGGDDAPAAGVLAESVDLLVPHVPL